LEHINYIANYSTGGQVLSIRSSPAKSTKSIKLPEILYPTSNEVRQNINQLLCTQWNPRLPSLLSEIDRYLCFMALHPYPDANKRVARLNLQLFLMRHKVIDCPIFPIGPSMHCRLPEFTALFRSWLITYEQSEILDFMLDISMDVIDSVTAVLFV
jgi:Fic family protein